MGIEYFYGAGRKRVTKPAGRPLPFSPRGKAATGRIAKILVGQAHGFIRLRDNREVFFHRGDLAEGTAFNDLQIGDAVTFELLEDAVSGARGLRVRQQKRHRAARAEPKQRREETDQSLPRRPAADDEPVSQT